MKNVLLKSIALANSFISSYPPYLIFFVTSRCNARCKMCFNSERQTKAKKQNELSLQEINQISKKYKKLLQLTITGGEPFLRSDIHEIVKLFYQNSGVKWVTIPTNGFYTETIFETTQKIISTCPNLSINIDISIDGCDENHDRIRRLPGAFKKAIETFELLSKIKKANENLTLKWTTVISPFNQFQITEIVQRLSSFDADDHELLLARGKFRDFHKSEITWQTYEKMINNRQKESYYKNTKGFERLFNVLYDRLYEVMIKTQKQKKMIYPCLAGKRFIEIYENGQVVPCEMRKWIQKDKTQGFGNIRDFNYDIAKLLGTSHSKNLIRKIENDYCYCTFECSILCSLIYCMGSYPHLFKMAIL